MQCSLGWMKLAWGPSALVFRSRALVDRVKICRDNGQCELERLVSDCLCMGLREWGLCHVTGIAPAAPDECSIQKQCPSVKRGVDEGWPEHLFEGKAVCGLRQLSEAMICTQLLTQESHAGRHSCLQELRQLSDAMGEDASTKRKGKPEASPHQPRMPASASPNVIPAAGGYLGPAQGGIGEGEGALLALITWPASLSPDVILAVGSYSGPEHVTMSQGLCRNKEPDASYGPRYEPWKGPCCQSQPIC
eukprot:1161561-Pelagomonas_calceolata.AAC.12